MTFKKIIFRLKNRILRPDAERSYKESRTYLLKTSKERERESFYSRKQLVEFAYATVVFYRDYYDKCGFHPSQLHSEADWDKVPILEKKMIRTHWEEMFSAKVPREKMYPSQTGGSTGKPLVVYKQTDVHYEVLAWRALGYYGIGPWDNEALVHRRVPISFMSRLKNRLIWWPTRRAYLSATAISDEAIDKFVNEIQYKRIKWVVGYCGSLEYVADFINRNKVVIDSVKMVWSTSSPLTNIVRKKIETAFRCPVMDQYGCCEMGNIAVQKPGEDCLTVNSDFVYVDIVDEDHLQLKGYVGDVCITDLMCNGFPLIKYRLGDRAALLQSFNESVDGFPKISFVKGRITDMLPLPNGKVLDGSFLTTICDQYHEHISVYQLYQHSDYSITFRVVPKSDTAMDKGLIADITNQLLKLSDGSISITTEITDRIEDFAGKRKFIISEISLNSQ